ncbi:DUF3558 domain-containing protein [Kibdelosporangium philippinense]|uniref:DUF3558 domain-containing protein n=1 Tax=Kibdelosporangium philippinense TaxID=211113 RepID=A0ABS8ZKP3_9PSEU|nr:DUF3558 domain-containing protein [Kibdelosporangium philippinense]MCE7008019.1 DUF3558 domain-containing protein [Kibdelosporangium philippinense]
MFRARDAMQVATVHGVFRSARVLPAAAVVLTFAACATPVDLGKTVTNKTTVKAAGSFNDDGLRMIDPCGLLADDLVSGIGKKKTSGVPDRRGYSECTYTVSDPESGKDIRMIVKVGSNLISAPKQVAKTVGGLGVFESRSSTSCSMTAITSRDPDHGLVATAYWDGGDPCAAANKLIETSVKAVIDGKAKYEDTPGSLVKLDPCAAIDDKTAGDVLGATVKKDPDDIRSCEFSARGASIRVKYTIDYDPATTAKQYNPTVVELSDKAKAAQKYKTSISPNRCQIDWLHRSLTGNRSENVNVSFERTPPDSSQDPCVKGETAAKAVAAKLAKS